MKKILAILTILSLAACATTTGNKFDAEKAANFKIGKTTYSQVVQALGESTSTSESADGSKTISYAYGSSRTKATTYIPVVGAFIGGADNETHVAVFSFNSKMILTTKSIINDGGKQNSGSNALTDASNQHSKQN